MRNYWDDIKLAANEALPWEKLQGCNVLVTGATGLIGGCLVEVLMARGDINVYAAGRNEARAKVRFAEYKDILYEPLKKALLQGNLLFNHRCDIIIKLAKLKNDAGIIGSTLM